MLKEYVDQGAKGFGEHKAGLPIDDPRMMALYEVCDDFKLPVLFQWTTFEAWTGRASRPGARPQGLPERQFPRPRAWLLGVDLGRRAGERLGGYPKGPVEPGGALDRLFDAYPNLWGDLSAGSGANAIGRDRAFGRGS